MNRLLSILLSAAIGTGLALALDRWIFFDPGYIEPDFQASMGGQPVAHAPTVIPS